MKLIILALKYLYALYLKLLLDISTLLRFELDKFLYAHDVLGCIKQPPTVKAKVLDENNIVKRRIDFIKLYIVSFSLT